LRSAGKEIGYVESSCLGLDGGPSFSISPSGFVLFGDAAFHIRRVEVFDRAFSRSEAASSSRSFMWFLPQEVRTLLLRSDKERGTAFTFAGILSKPAPAWRNVCFHGIFLDRFMETGYGDANDVQDSLKSIAFLGLKVLNSDHAVCHLLTAETKTVIQHILSGMGPSIDLAKKISAAAKQGTSQSIYNLLLFHKEKLSKLRKGDFLIVSVGVFNQDLHDAAVLIQCFDDEVFEVTIVNPCSNPENAFHSVKLSSLPYKRKYLTSFSLGKVSKDRVFDMSWWLWLFVFRCKRSSRNDFASFYSVVGWLRDEPFDVTVDNWEGCLDSEENIQVSDYRSVPTSSSGHHKVVTESVYYLCRRLGLPRSSVKTFFLGLRVELSHCIRKDLPHLHVISRSERKLIQLGVQQMCFSVLKFGEGLLDLDAKDKILGECLQCAESIYKTLETTHEANEYAVCESVLQLGQGICSDAQATRFPLFEYFMSNEDLAGLGGGELDYDSGIAEDLIHDNLERVKTFHDGLDKIRRTLRLMFILEANRERLRLCTRLILLIAERMFTHVLPVPLGPLTRRDPSKKCIWSCTQVNISQQKEAVHLLASLSFHIVSAAADIEWDEHFHMAFTCILGCITAIADAVLRVNANEKAGGMSEALNSGFFVSSDIFQAQATVFPVYCAKLLHLRVGVLDYFRY
jgi:hypothetical protein